MYITYIDKLEIYKSGRFYSAYKMIYVSGSCITVHDPLISKVHCSKDAAAHLKTREKKTKALTWSLLC